MTSKHIRQAALLMTKDRLIVIKPRGPWLQMFHNVGFVKINTEKIGDLCLFLYSLLCKWIFSAQTVLSFFRFYYQHLSLSESLNSKTLLKMLTFLTL